VDEQLNTALTHVGTVYGLYIGQRQNVVNYYLAGIGLLSVAYAAAIDKGRAPVAVAVCVLGVLASAAAYLQDKRLRTPMDRAEAALRELQALLAGPGGLNVPSLEIQKEIDLSKGAGLSRGVQIRALYGAVALVFVLGAVYAAAWAR
jgi:hypothetical protein